MKKNLIIAALGVAGIMSGKTVSGLSLKTNEKKISSKLLIEYRYLYQSSCGWTYTMTSTTAIQNMTETQFNNYMLDVNDMNDYVCKLHGQKPNTNYTFNQKNSSNVKKGRI